MNKVFFFGLILMTSMIGQAADYKCLAPRTTLEKSQQTDFLIQKSEKLVKKIQSMKSNSQIEKKQNAIRSLVQYAGCLSLIDPSGYIGEVLYPVYVVDKKNIDAELSKLSSESASKLKYFIDLYASGRNKGQ